MDENGNFTAQAYKESDPSVNGSYTMEMATNKNYRFFHQIYSSNAYIDDYQEFENTVYDYDEGTYGIGARTSMVDPVGTTEWEFDARGRVITETRQIEPTGEITQTLTFVTQWGYNSADGLEWMQYPGGSDGSQGETVTFDYNAQMMLDSLTGDVPAVTGTTYIDSTTYDAAGRVVERDFGANGTVTTAYTFNDWDTAGGRLQRILTSVGANSRMDLRYTYDTVGNITKIEDYEMGTDAQNPQTQNFTYDWLDRLTSAEATGGDSGDGDYNEETYTYDATTGNLASKAGVNYTYGDSDHTHAVTALNNGNAYTYDDNGNMSYRKIEKGAVDDEYNLAYDAENHMIGVTGAYTATFGYNGDGSRVVATEDGSTKVFIGNYYEYKVSDDTAKSYYYAGAVRIAVRDGSGELFWLVGDHLGSTSVVLEEDGTLEDRQLYDAWGEIRLEGTLPTNYAYTGQYLDHYAYS
jgi:hypothetical protein